MWESQFVTIVMSGNCIVWKSSQLWCGGIAVWGSCGVGELRSGELRCGELWCGGVAVWGNSNVGEW